MATPERTLPQEPTRSSLFSLIGANRQAREQAEKSVLELRDDMLKLIEWGKPIANITELCEAAGIDRSYYYQLVKGTRGSQARPGAPRKRRTL